MFSWQQIRQFRWCQIPFTDDCLSEENHSIGQMTLEGYRQNCNCTLFEEVDSFHMKRLKTNTTHWRVKTFVRQLQQISWRKTQNMSIPMMALLSPQDWTHTGQAIHRDSYMTPNMLSSPWHIAGRHLNPKMDAKRQTVSFSVVFFTQQLLTHGEAVFSVGCGLKVVKHCFITTNYFPRTLHWSQQWSHARDERTSKYWTHLAKARKTWLWRHWNHLLKVMELSFCVSFRFLLLIMSHKK